MAHTFDKLEFDHCVDLEIDFGPGSPEFDTLDFIADYSIICIEGIDENVFFDETDTSGFKMIPEENTEGKSEKVLALGETRKSKSDQSNESVLQEEVKTHLPLKSPAISGNADEGTQSPSLPTSRARNLYKKVSRVEGRTKACVMETKWNNYCSGANAPEQKIKRVSILRNKGNSTMDNCYTVCRSII